MALPDQRPDAPPCVELTPQGKIITYVPKGVGTFFRRVQAALEPGGLFVFDFIESAERRTYAARTVEDAGWSLVARADLSASGRILTRRLTATRLIGNRWRRTRETHRVRIYGRHEIERALAGAGFSARIRRSYGRYRLMPGDLVAIARKS